MTLYNWQQTDWPNFHYQLNQVESLLYEYKEKTGKIAGLLQGLNPTLQTDAQIELLLAEAMNTSAIEGETLSRIDVMSSIRNHLGLNPDLVPVKDQRAQGIATLLLGIKDNFDLPLSKKMLFEWHSVLLPKALYPRAMQIGQWRTHAEPMQIVSGLYGKIKVHFEAPPSKDVPQEMKQFIRWFNQTAPGKKNQIEAPIIRAAIAHLYFETIHPFEDGNGRIGRAIAEKALSQELHRPVFLSLSHAIEKNKKAYYEALKLAQRMNDISSWLKYFIQTILSAQISAEKSVNFILQKSQFLDQLEHDLNPRQQKVILRMLATDTFEGGMNAKKYISLTKTSKATATRDLSDLVERKILKLLGDGRSTSYEINWVVDS